MNPGTVPGFISIVRGKGAKRQRGATVAKAEAITPLGCAKGYTYSYRSASMGLRFAARLAGHTPKITPVATLTPKASTITSGLMMTVSMNGTTATMA